MRLKSICMWSFGPKRTVYLDVIQGILIGVGLAFITIFILPKAYVTKVNGWTAMVGCGEPGNGILLRGACAITFMGPINVPQEAMYWTTKVDEASQKLSGAHDYRMHFAAGQLPPNQAFWSLTMGDAKNQFVPNPINRYSVSDRSGLVANADGSVDIYIQNAAPAGARVQTGCPHHREISSSGCACICRVKLSWTASTRYRRSSKVSDACYET